jgi:hypothetical protein
LLGDAKREPSAEKRLGGNVANIFGCQFSAVARGSTFPFPAGSAEAGGDHAEKRGLKCALNVAGGVLAGSEAERLFARNPEDSSAKIGVVLPAQFAPSRAINLAGKDGRKFAGLGLVPGRTAQFELQSMGESFDV